MTNRDIVVEVLSDLGEALSDLGCSIYKMDAYIFLVTYSTMYKLTIKSNLLNVESKIRKSGASDFHKSVIDLGDPELINKLRKLIK